MPREKKNKNCYLLQLNCQYYGIEKIKNVIVQTIFSIEIWYATEVNHEKTKLPKLFIENQ